MLSKEDYDIVLATSTGALPAWMARKYPEVERVDYEGRRHKFGQRHNACPNSGSIPWLWQRSLPSAMPPIPM